MVLWTCPSCQHQKNIVCPVCGEDKKAGATCTACGSEYSHTICPKCSHEEWEEQPMNKTSYDEKIGEILFSRREKYLTYYEIMRFFANIEPNSLPLLCLNDPIEVKQKTQEAFKIKERGNAIEVMCSLKGVTPETAKTLLKKYGDPKNEGSDKHKGCG